MESSAPTRGERNNNPGNIDFEPRNSWRGQVGIESPPEPGARPRFAVFDCAENGIRAIGKLLLHYRRAGGCHSLRAMLERWAPATENDAAAYVADVARRLGVAPEAPLDLENPTLLQALLAAIIRHENGRCIYSPEILAEGARRALASS